MSIGFYCILHKWQSDERPCPACGVGITTPPLTTAGGSQTERGEALIQAVLAARLSPDNPNLQLRIWECADALVIARGSGTERGEGREARNIAAALRDIRGSYRMPTIDYDYLERAAALLESAAPQVPADVTGELPERRKLYGFEHKSGIRRYFDHKWDCQRACEQYTGRFFEATASIVEDTGQEAILGPQVEGRADAGGATQPKDLPNVGERCRTPIAESTGSDTNVGAKPASESFAVAQHEKVSTKTEAEEALIRQVLYLHLHEVFPNEAGLATLANRVSAERSATSSTP